MIGPNKDSSDYKLYQKGAPEHMTGKLLQPNNLEWLDEIRDRYITQSDIKKGSEIVHHIDETTKLAITAKINEMLISELEKLDNDFMPKDTNCAEFYQDSDDSCEPIEHARRSGRFEVDMELHDFITDRIAELRKRKDEVLK